MKILNIEITLDKAQLIRLQNIEKYFPNIHFGISTINGVTEIFYPESFNISLLLNYLIKNIKPE